MNHNEALEVIQQDVTWVSAKLARNWKGVTTPEDSYQELLLKVVEQNLLIRLAEMTGDDRRIILSRLAGQFLVQERTDLLHFSGQYRYSTHEVSRILKAGALVDLKNEISAERMDIEVGLEALQGRNIRYAQLIARAYLNQEELNTVDTRALHRAVDALTEHMNYSHRLRTDEYEGPGTRKALSNSQAEYVSRRDYSGDDADPEGVFG